MDLFFSSFSPLYIPQTYEGREERKTTLMTRIEFERLQAFRYASLHAPRQILQAKSRSITKREGKSWRKDSNKPSHSLGLTYHLRETVLPRSGKMPYLKASPLGRKQGGIPSAGKPLSPPPTKRWNIEGVKYPSPISSNL